MTENFLLILGVALFLISGIATFCFGRISVKHIEKEMAREGQSPPEWDKGIGARITIYAIVIVTKKLLIKLWSAFCEALYA